MLRQLLILIFLAGLGASQAIAAPDGAALFSRNCAACHGSMGTGGIGVPLALPSFQASISDDYLRQTIRLGRPGRVMPAFGNLKPDEIEAIVNAACNGSRAPLPCFRFVLPVC